MVYCEIKGFYSPRLVIGKDMPTIMAIESHFYSVLSKNSYSYVKKQFINGNIFEHDLTIIPIHTPGHWSLAIVLPEYESTYYLDSLHRQSPSCQRKILKFVKDLPQDQYNAALPTGWQILSIEYAIPRQKNCSDCGIFVLILADYISRRVTTFDFTKAHMQLFRQRICYEIMNKRLLPRKNELEFGVFG